MCLDCFTRVTRYGSTVLVDWIPHTHQYHARKSDAHGPGYRLDCDLSDAAARTRVPPVHNLAIIVIVSAECIPYVSYFLGNIGGDLAVHDILVLVAAAHGNRVAVVVFERRLASGWRGRWPVFALQAAGCAWGPIEGNVGEKDSRELCHVVVCVWEFCGWQVFAFDIVVGQAWVRTQTLSDAQFALYEPLLLLLCVLKEVFGRTP